MNKRICTTIFSLILMSAPAWVHAASKVALVIGNSEYKAVTDRLKNPVNDAKAIAQSLKAAGYQTTLVLNAGLDNMLDSLSRVKEQVDVGGTIVFYYAGHGIQFDGQNFLVPTDARLADRERASREALLLQDVVRKLDDSGAAAKVLIVDACRNDPFPKAYRSNTRGLARMQDQLPARGLMIMYAASPGEVAQDGKGAHGTFTEALLNELARGQERLTELMDNVVDNVRQSTAGQQNPYYEGTGLSRLVLVTGQMQSGSSRPEPTAVEPAPLQLVSNAAIEAGFWQAIVNSSDIEDFQEYLTRFPEGNYVYLAKKKIKQFQDEQVRIAEEKAWAVTVSSNDEAQFADFLQKFPAGIHAAEARKKQDAIKLAKYQRADDSQWQAIANSVNARDFKAYLTAFSDGKYVAQATDRYNQLLELERNLVDEEAWSKIANSTVYQDFQGYLDKFPHGKYQGAARLFLDKYKKQFELEDKAWQLIANSKNPADFDKHLRLFPQGVYARSAQEKRDVYQAEQEQAETTRIQDEQLWRTTKRAWNLETLQAYLTAFPQGIHSDDARKGKLELEQAQQKNKWKQEDEAEWRRIASSRDSKDFIRYQLNFPQGQYLEQAKKLQKKLEDAQLAELDEQRWQSIRDKQDARVFSDYLTDFPAGRYVDQAKRQLKKLADARQSELDEQRWQNIRNQKDVKLFTDYLAEFPAGRFRDEAQQLVDRLSKGVTVAVMPLQKMQDCADCPELVLVPKGSLVMGGEQEKPLHQVTINYALAVGKYEVTIGQYQQCVADKACDMLPKGMGETDQHPVYGVRWQDAQNYLNWLSAKTRQYYRLPTEAEWEYVARAGSTGNWFYGEQETDACLYGNIADLGLSYGMGTVRTACDDHAPRSAPVGIYHPNAFGLYDTLGNVYEWVQDCYHDSYDNAPVDGSAWQEPKCRQRVLRGGSWVSPAIKARSASRIGFDVNDRFYQNGFRVVRQP